MLSTATSSASCQPASALTRASSDCARARIGSSSHWALLAACACLLGCATTPAPTPWTWSDAAPSAQESACAAAFDAACEVTLLDARIAGDRARWGQALAGVVASDPTQAGAPLGWALAKGLNPSAWVPPSQRASLSTDAPDPAPMTPPAEVILLGDADPSALGDRATQALDVPWPSEDGRGALSREALASMWAQAMGAHAALTPDDAQVVPVAPHLERLLGVPIAGIPPQQIAAALSIAEADRLLTAGDPARALRMLDDAAAALDAAAAPCRARGALAYLRSRLAAVSDPSRATDLLDETKRLCAQAQGLPPAEQRLAAYLNALLLLQDNFVGVTSRADWPSAWQAPGGIDAQSQALASLRAQLDPRPTATLDALWDSAQRYIAHGQDLCLRHLPIDAAALDAPRDRLSALGREDLAQALYSAQLSQFQAISFERIHAWVQWARRWPWQEADLLGRGVVEIGRKSWLIPLPHGVLLACDAALAAHTRQVSLDTSPGFAQRHAQRWLWSMTLTPACGTQAVGDLGAHILTHAASLGPDALMSQLSEMFESSQLYQTIMLNLSTMPSLSHALSLAAKGALRALPTSDDPDALTARAALTLLDITTQQARAMLGAAPSDYDLGAALQVVQRQLAVIPTSASGAARYAPLLRFFALSARAIAATLSPQPAGDDPTADLDAFVRGDLSPLLAPFAATHHADALRTLSLNLLALSQATRSSDRAALPALGAALAAAPAPSVDDPLGFFIEVGHVALLEVHGVLLYRAQNLAAAQRSWAAAADRLPALALRATTAFHLQDSGLAPFLSLLPLTHHLILAGALAPDDDDLLQHILSPQNSARILEVLNDVERQLLASPDDAAPMLLAITRILRDGVHNPNLSAAFDGDPAALADFADIFAQHAADTPAPVHAALLTFAGMMRFPQNPSAAQAHWGDTLRLLSSSSAADFNPLVLPLLNLSMIDITHTPDPAAALTLLDDLINASPSCERAEQFAFAALLPWRAHLLERLNRHAEADQTLAQYITLTQYGFSGSAEVMCHFESQHRSALLAFDIGANIGADLRPMSTKSAHINLGFQTLPRSRDVIKCTISPILGYRPDVVMAAHLARAAYALRANDDAVATDALLMSIYEGQRLLYGTYNILGPFALPFSDARDQTNLTFIRQVATFALARGHVSSSIALQEIASALSLYVPDSNDDEPDPNTLARPLLPFPDLQPLASLTPPLTTPDQPVPTTLTPTQRKLWNQIPGVLPWIEPLAPALSLWHPARPNLHATLVSLCPPKSKAPLCQLNPRDPLPHALYLTLLDITRLSSPDDTTPSLFSLSSYRDTLQTFAAAPDPQAILRLSSAIPALMRAHPPDQTIPLLDQTLQALPHATYPIEYASVLSVAFGTINSPETLDNFGDLIAFTAETLTDKISAEQAIRFHLTRFNYLGRLQRYDQMLPIAQGLFQATSRVPSTYATSLIVGIIHTLLRLHADQLPPQELDAWITYWSKADIDPALLQRLQATRDALAKDPLQARNLASQIIRSFF
jgi:hypothetical protein